MKSDARMRPAGPLVVTRWQRYKYFLTSPPIRFLALFGVIAIIGAAAWFEGVPRFQEWRAEDEQAQSEEKSDYEELPQRLPSPTQLRVWEALRTSMKEIPELIAKSNKAGLDSVEASLRVAHSLGERGLAIANPQEVIEITESVQSAIKQGQSAIRAYEGEVEAKKKAAEEEAARKKAEEEAARLAELSNQQQHNSLTAPSDSGGNSKTEEYEAPAITPPAPAPTPPPSQTVSTSTSTGSCPAGTTVTFTGTGGGVVTISAGGRTSSGSGSASITLQISGSVTATATATGNVGVSYSADENC